MKKLLLLFVFIYFSISYAQITTPGEGTLFTFSDFANDTTGTVTATGPGTFTLTRNLTVSANDTLLLDAATQSLHIEGAVSITILGCVQCEERENPLEINGIRTEDTAALFEWRFEDASPSVLKKLRITAGESITLIQSSVSIQFCEFSQFNRQVIQYINCNPIILHCNFHDNRQAAINSAANVTGSPIICYNQFYHNVLDNVNQPQINLGPGTNGREILIEGNTIEGYSAMSGGIAIANLLNVGPTQVVIRSNTVENNRYGYTQQGSDIFALIEDNDFINNDLETNPMNGGSGICIYGYDTTCAAKLRRNIISGNLWGITAINQHSIDMGTAGDFGNNRIFDNANGGQTYALYNNASSSMTAVGNYWGGDTEEFAESVIFHRPDLGDNYGLVLYTPFLTSEQVAIADNDETNISVYPNPTNGIVNIQMSPEACSQNSEIQVFDMYGRRLDSIGVNNYSPSRNVQIDLSRYSTGIYLVEIITGGKVLATKKIIKE